MNFNCEYFRRPFPTLPREYGENAIKSRDAIDAGDAQLIITCRSTRKDFDGTIGLQIHAKHFEDNEFPTSLEAH
jgi:hypothetical protein